MKEHLRWSAFREALGVSLLIIGVGQAVAGQPDSGPPAHVSSSDKHDASPPLHTIRPNPPRAGALRELREPMLPHRTGSGAPSGPDPVLQPVPGPGATPVTDLSFEGNNNSSGVLPPDTVGGAGPNHYVQAVNLVFSVYNKSGTRLYGPANINTLFSGFTTPCQTSNDGDPVVLYDHLADRWLISQFALPNYPFGPFYQCVAVSQTADPLGAWYRYQFLVSNNKMNDYPKIGVWPDGYYMSMNQFNQGSGTWAGGGAAVFERDKMLLGQTARMVYFDLYGTDPNLGGMLPSDLDGATLPPAGSPDYFAEVDDDAWGYSPDQLQIWALQTNWANPTFSTFTRATTLPVASFDSNMCGYARNCIPQPGGTKVDAIADRLMFRLQYRNFGAYQTLAANHTVDVDGTDHAGIRWYELRNTGSGWSVYQQGTYAPDSNHRWMGSVALDGGGNMALGYSISSTGVYPSIRYTGRLAGDPLGQMTLGEGSIMVGSGYQTHSSGRWGDYSSMTVDPDDCTFWYTQEYYQTASLAGWQTRVGSFKLGSCAPPPPAPAAPTKLGASAVSSSQINLSWTSNSSGSESGFKIERCSGVNCSNFAFVAQVGTGVTAYPDTGLSPSTSYSYRVYAFNAGGNSAYSNVSTAATQAAPTMHVGDLAKSTTAASRNWKATVAILVHDASHAALAGATVSGTWSGGASGNASCTTTGTAGTCGVTISVSNKRTSVTFTVSNVTKSGYSYNSAANHDPDSDSNGTVITVTKP